MYSSILSPLPLARWFIEQVVSEGNYVIDCTAGNGHDTAFLARLVGPHGKVYAFDIQQEAIESTRNRLRSHGLADRVQCILSSHEQIKNHVKENIHGAMLNLGYLPGGDHQITTCHQSTKQAINGVLDLLVPGGIITIVVYPGHTEGKNEEYMIEELIASLDPKVFGIMVGRFIKLTTDPPQLFVIQKNTAGDNESGVSK